MQRTYRDKKCQKKDWKTVHRKQCKKLQQVFIPPPAGWRERAGVGGGGERGAGDESGGAAAGGEGGGGSDVGGDEGDENLCPICLDNEDVAYVDGTWPLLCCVCGQLFCGACIKSGLSSKSPSCPTCRAPFRVSREEQFKRLWKLVNDRSPGRHTKWAQFTLGQYYMTGEGVRPDAAEAFKWTKLAADHGLGSAIGFIGAWYMDGNGVPRDRAKGVQYFQRGAGQTATEDGQSTAAMRCLSRVCLMYRTSTPSQHHRQAHA